MLSRLAACTVRGGVCQLRQFRQLSSSVTTMSEVEEWYRSQPTNFYNFPVENAIFRKSENFRGDPEPALFYPCPEEGEVRGIQHLSPPACSIFSKAKLEGNYGDDLRFKTGHVKVETPADVTLQVGISTEGLEPEDSENEMMLEYFEWLESLQTKYFEFLADNITDYDALRHRYSALVDQDRQLLQEMLRSQSTVLIRTLGLKEDETLLRDYDIRYMMVRHKLYKKSHNAEMLAHAKFRCDLDRVAQEQGLYRHHIPIWDSHAEKLNDDDYRLLPRDAIVLDNVLDSSMFEIGHNVMVGMRPTLKSITLVHRSKHEMKLPKRNTAPCGDISHLDI